MSPDSRAIAYLEAGGCLLTPGLRQARIFRRLHDRAQLAAGKSVWPSARVFPLDTWLLELWREAGVGRDDLPQPLSVAALGWMWRRQAAQVSSGLLDAAALGTQARQSWLTLRAHHGTLADLARFPLTRDQQAFLAWARAAETDLRERGSCDPMDIARLFVEHDAVPAPGPPLMLAGFRRLSPIASALCESLRTRGWSVARLERTPDDNVLRQHIAADPPAERRALLDWIRDRLDRRPGGLFAAVVPDLDAVRGALERDLLAALQPELELAGAREASRVFDLAGGAALASQPVAESAIDCIAAAIGALDWPLASRALRSRFLAGAVIELEQRCRIDVELRCRPGVSAPTVGSLVVRADAGGAPRFATSLRVAAASLAGPPRRRAAAWAEAFGACLAAWGWPGEIALGSREFQAAAQLREILRELAAASTFAPAFAAGEALDEIRRLAAAPFQPESGEPSVFVLDRYDDPGVHFDGLWVAGLTAAAWPRPVAIDPLLPIEIQRRLGLPRVTADACVAEAREIIDGWRAASGELVVSWPRRENDTDVDGTPLLPAGAAELAVPAAHPARDTLAFAAARREPVVDGALPRLRGIAHGGARVVELQSLCPFRAFAELRLHADRLEEPRAGVDRRLRGVAIHRALQDLWAGIGLQRALLEIPPGPLAARVLEAVERALADVLPAGCGARTLALECEWQRRAIGSLLELERTRPPFTVVETERALTGRIGGLELGLRVDRVDRVDHELVVIDYKSGRVRKAPWRGARMEAPQLPLYAVLHPSGPAAIAVAELGAGGAAYRGVARHAGVIDSLTPALEFELTEERETGFEWEHIRERWHAWLERLAGDHADGRAEVDPKLGAETCRPCHLSALCRVAAAADDEPGAAEADNDG